MGEAGRKRKRKGQEGGSRDGKKKKQKKKKQKTPGRDGWLDDEGHSLYWVSGRFKCSNFFSYILTDLSLST
jgi:hypothetical protein